jgi:hypothetical protein
MNTAYVLGGLLAAGLSIDLSVALLKAEEL